MADGSFWTPEDATLLPGSSTPLERALALIDRRILALPADIIRTVKQPDLAPAHLLPHLAWERSVDVWDPSWPDDLKRRVIAASYIVHRYKGTRYAVEKALEALGFKASITEWWQTTPQGQPYTFHVRGLAVERILAGAPLINEPMQRAAYAAVLAAKPHSRAFTFDVGAGFSGRVAAAACGRVLAIAPQAVAVSPPLAPSASFLAGVRSRALIVDFATATASPPLTPAAHVIAAARGRGLQIVTAHMETIQ